MQVTINDTVTVSLRKIGKSLEVDFAKMPAQSVQHVFEYGIRQILNDAMASAKTEAEALASSQKRLDNLMSGTLRASPVREGDPVKRRALEIATDKVKASQKFRDWLAANKLKLSDKEAVAALRKAAEKNHGAFMEQARKDVEAAKGLDLELELDL